MAVGREPLVEKKTTAIELKPTNNDSKKRFSFKEKREFENLQKEIEDLSDEKINTNNQLNSGNLPFEELQKLSNRIAEITALLDEKEMRWLQLSEFED